MSKTTINTGTETATGETGEFSVSDELYEISEATNKDGTVDVEIYDFEKENDDKVRVHFHTPTMDQQSEVMDWPSKDRSGYKFVRICRKTVGSLSGAKWLKVDGATIRADPEEWEIDASLTRREKTAANIRSLTLSGFIDVSAELAIILAVIGLGLYTIGVPVYSIMTLLGWVPALSAGFLSLSTSMGTSFFVFMFIVDSLLPQNA